MKKIFLAVIFCVLSIYLFSINSCDAFENFLLNLPISFVITASGSGNPSGSGSGCLEDDDLYRQYQDKINSISLIEIRVAVLNVDPNNLSGDAALNIYGGTNANGELLISYQMNNLRPADYQIPNEALKLSLTAADIQNVNAYLADDSNSKCFYGRLDVTDVQNGGNTNTIQVRIDALYQVNTKL